MMSSKDKLMIGQLDNVASIAQESLKEDNGFSSEENAYDHIVGKPIGPYIPIDHTGDVNLLHPEMLKEAIKQIHLKEKQELQETSTAILPNNLVQTITHRRPDSDLAVQITNLTNMSIRGLDFAGLVSKVALEGLKISTRAGLEIARAVTGVRQERMVARRRDGESNGAGYFLSRLIDAPSYLLHHTLSLTEQIAMAGLEFTSETIQYTISTVAESMTIIDTLFGTTDTARSLTEFVALVKREWNTNQEVEPGLMENIGSFGIFRVIKALTAWAAIQYVTSERWETELHGWKKVKLVDLYDLLDDWVEINDDGSIYDEFGWLIEEEEDEEMVVISSKNNGAKIVVGELLPHQQEDSHSRNSRLGDKLSEATKRISNPYMEEFTNYSEEEKMYALLHNLKRYSKFSSTAYDLKTAILNHLPFHRHHTKTQHRITFARQNQLPLESIVHSSHSHPPSDESHYSPTYYLIRDHSSKSIILALRGTMSIHDLIVDLSCDYIDFVLPEDVQRGVEIPYQLHKGIFNAAKMLATPGKSSVFEALKREMELNEDYGLVLVGHSLGAGVASILALLLSSPTTCMTTRWSKLPLGRRVHAYAFAAPCVMSAELSIRSKPLVTSVAYGNDVICRLSLGHILDLRNMVFYLGKTKAENGSDLTRSIITKFLEYQSQMGEKEELEEYFWKIRREVDKRMSMKKLYPAGRIYWIIGKDRVPYCFAKDEENNEDADSMKEDIGHPQKRNDHTKYNVVEIQDVEEIFGEILFAPTMSLDHLPTVYENVLKGL
ncbi:hypothetical protein G9A89_003790 [Geosiphon pyriformis]|nr:hypothetical protein G9A89_003790 [Geosiphon pyriformis]